MTLGSKIRTLRNLRSLTQESMAELLDISTNAYGKIERNQTNPSYQRLEKIASVLEIPMAELVSFGDANHHLYQEKKQKDFLTTRVSMAEFNKMKHEITKLELKLSHVQEVMGLLKIK